MITTEATEIIDEKIIENCELNGACSEALKWVRKQPRTFAELREYREPWIYWLAENSSMPAVLEKLSSDAYSDVRYYVAQNANTPVAVLEKLSSDADSGVRRGVAQNANTPVAVLEKLSSDADSGRSEERRVGKECLE